MKLRASGVNPSDVKSRAGLRTKTLAFPRIVPHSDGAGVIDAVGAGVSASRVGERVWIWNAAWRRAFGTAAEFVVLPAAQAVGLPERTGFDAGACLGIPALTHVRPASVRCCRSIPLPSTSANPAEMTNKARTPFCPHSFTTDKTASAGTTTTARSTGSGISRTDG